MNDVYLPILKDNKDPHYRYKMPKLTAKIEGSGNGIKTVITNMSAVAKSIDRPPAYPTKYFGCELGAQVTIANDLFIVNGSHDVDKLQNLLYKFIKQFVLCSKCSNPETSLTIVKQSISQKCIACGYETTLPKALHKLTTFIINHPPDGSAGPSTAKNGKSKSDKSSSGKSSSKKSGSSPTNVVDKAARKAAHGEQQFNVDGNDDDGDAFDEAEFETSAYAERMRELTDGFSNGIYASDTKENANIFYKLVKERKEAGQLADAGVQSELVREAERLDIKDKATLVLCELLFDDTSILAQIKANRLLLLRFCRGNRKAQKYLLGGYEKLVGDVYKDKLFAQAMVIMKALYDEDVLEEEAIFEWASKESKRYVGKEMSRKIHEKVAPFVKWLKEAEEESSDEEEEEEEDGEGSDGASSGKSNDSEERKVAQVGSNGTNGVQQQQQKKANDDQDEEDEVEFSHRVSGLRIQETVMRAVATEPVNATTNGSANEVEDLDIDNI
jgi:translation initiation factor 5